jgi:hypothetical protein
MTAKKRMVVRMAGSAVLFFFVPSVVSFAAAQQSGSLAEPPRVTANVADPMNLPDSPGVTLAKLQPQNPLHSDSAQQSSSPASAQPQGQQAQTQQQAPQNPVGTAAAEPTHAAGIAASQPAGVAIAPAKQHRVRTIVIRVGAIIGAGVAVGTIVALTAATPSKPPGAH